MKHLFVINSHTTFLTAMGTVEYLHLSEDGVIFAYMRNYKNTVVDVPYRVVDVTELYDNTVLYYNGKPLKDVVNEIDKFVDREIKEEYSLYIPHLVVPLFKILYTNIRCKRVSYIQEGAYTSRKAFCTDIPLYKRMKNFIKLRFCGDRWFDGEWYMAGTIYKQRSLDSYAINDKFWEYLPSCNHIIRWPKVELNLKLDRTCPIFIFDGFIKNGHAEAEVYMWNIRKLIIEYSSSAGNYIKFHPAQSEDEQKEIRRLFHDERKKISIIDNAIPMELIITSTNKMTFVGFGSSLLFYAHDNGHTVYCHDDWMKETSEKYRNLSMRYGVPTFKEYYDKNK